MEIPCFVSRTLVAAVFLAPFSSFASDDIMAGVAYGGPQQTQAVCYLFNAGDSSLSIRSKSLIPEPPFGTTPFPLTYDTCGPSLAAGGVCAFVAQLTFNGGTACKVTISNSKDVRGALEIRNSSNGILNNVELR
jgi:hypothetical protein